MEAKTVKSNMTDMTQGSPAGLILFFALPLLVGNMFQQLYNMVDSIVVGRFVGSTALAAVGTAFPVVFLLSSMFMGLGIGAMVMVSQFYGAGDAERLKATIDTIYTALIVGIVPLSIVGILVSRPIIALLAVPAFAEGGASGPLDTINNLSDLVFQCVRAVGVIVAGYGIVQIGLAVQSHDSSQRANGFLAFFGGLLIMFAKEILDFITV